MFTNTSGRAHVIIVDNNTPTPIPNDIQLNLYESNEITNRAKKAIILTMKSNQAKIFTTPSAKLLEEYFFSSLMSVLLSFSFFGGHTLQISSYSSSVTFNAKGVFLYHPFSSQ